MDRLPVGVTRWRLQFDEDWVFESLGIKDEDDDENAE